MESQSTVVDLNPICGASIPYLTLLYISINNNINNETNRHDVKCSEKDKATDKWAG